ncbi:MAG TPA: mechanosensitive ion channel domain-containing protein [Armatimonadota bacterium]|jgi:small conductance mechanosensitive channel
MNDYGSFFAYFRQVWLGQLPGQLIRAILVAALFELLVYLLRQFILRRLHPVLLRDAGDSAPLRVQRRRLLLNVPLVLARAVLYVIALLVILRIFRVQTGAEILPVGLALLGATLVVFWKPLRDAAQGYLIMYDHLYTRGDRVRLAGHEGTVQDLHLRWTYLVTDEGAMVVVPHTQVGEIVNLSRRQKPAVVEPPAEGA